MFEGRGGPREEGDVRVTALLVSGDGQLQRSVRDLLGRKDQRVRGATSAREGLLALRRLEPRILLVDLDLPDVQGVRVVDVFCGAASGLPVVALSRRGRLEDAVDALRHGAVDYVAVGDGVERLGAVVERALLEAGDRRHLEDARAEVHDRYGFSHLLSQSPRMGRIFDAIRAVAPTDATVLVRGETGTGKELVSRAVHLRSRRSGGPFVSVNCGAFAESLLESELFGHERGSFTGATGRREGLFEMADGGTLFLDELGETSPSVQVNLLRVLEEMTFRRVGGRDPVTVDVRILAATNVSLEEEVRAGRFREDLFYRLNVFPIELPPLRERREDIPLLMRHFLDEFAANYSLDPPVVSSEALRSIRMYRWPGNVRQLRSMCERWVITRHGRRLELDHLPEDMSGGTELVGEEIGEMFVDESADLRQNVERVTEQMERVYLARVLQRCDGHLENAAGAAGISRRTLYTKMKAYGLSAGDFKGI